MNVLFNEMSNSDDMGSWNSICVTIPTDSPEEFVEELETILQQEWSDLKGAVEVPADVEGAFERENIQLADFEIKTRGECVYCHHASHGVTYCGLMEFFYVLLTHLSPQLAVRVLQFEDGQGECAVYEDVESASEFDLENRTILEEIGYVEVWKKEDQNSAYGAEHAVNAVGTEYGIDIGIGKLGEMYVLEVNRHRLR